MPVPALAQGLRQEQGAQCVATKRATIQRMEGYNVEHGALTSQGTVTNMRGMRTVLLFERQRTRIERGSAMKSGYCHLSIREQRDGLGQ